MKKYLAFILLLLCFTVCVSAKETVIYQNDFSSSDLSAFKVTGEVEVKDGMLRAKDVGTTGAAAFISYVLPAQYQGKDFVVEADYIASTYVGGVMVGATSDSLTTTPSPFSGYMISTTKAGKTEFSCFNESGAAVRLCPGTNAIPEEKVHLYARSYKGVLTVRATSLDGKTLYQEFRYEPGDSTSDIYNTLTSTAGLYQYYGNKGGFDNFKVTVIEDDVIPALTDSVTVGGVKFDASGLLADANAVSGSGAMLSSEAESGSYRIVCSVAAKGNTRVYFGMKDAENGYAFEINQRESAVFFYKIEGGVYTVLGEKVTVIGDNNANNEAIERVSGVCFVDNANGNNKNDGKSADTAVKNYGVGVVEKLPVGGTIVVSGKSHISASGNPAEFSFNTWGKGVTITSVYDGVDYRKENADAAFSIAENTILHIYSDITFDNINLVCDGKDCVIYVHSGAMLSVTDAVEFISKAEGGKHYTIKLEKGAYAHLSKAAMTAFTVVGEGDIIPYVNGYTDIFSAALGTTTMVQLTIGSTTAYVNGVAQTLDAAPINRNNRTMLPVRFLANAFGVDNDGIKWDGATRTATLTNSEVTIVVTIDSPTMTVNGNTVALDSPAIIEQNRTYLPVRAIANALGVSNENIGWMAATNTATLLK